MSKSNSLYISKTNQINSTEIDAEREALIEELDAIVSSAVGLIDYCAADEYARLMHGQFKTKNGIVLIPRVQYVEEFRGGF
jgi:hypothetical protein